MNIFPIATVALVSALSCAPKVPPSAPSSAVLDDGPSLAPVMPVATIQSLTCSSTLACTVFAADGIYEVALDGQSITLTDEPPTPAADVWPARATRLALAEDWNARTKNGWRSPFQATIPSPDGGVFKHHRSATPGTSRIARLGGHVMTARQGLDPETAAYPWTLALHPTGTEAYHIVWSNTDLIAFNTRTLETSWRIRLSGPAVGLFVSADGRYLVAELDAVASEEQLLDFDPVQRHPPDGEEPFGDGAWTGIDRPAAGRTVLVDLSLGQAVAEVPGHFVGFHAFDDGAVIAGTGGIARVEWSGG